MKQRIIVGILALTSIILTGIYWKTTKLILEDVTSIDHLISNSSFESDSSLFLFRAYRSRTGNIRIYSINKCLSPNFNLIGKIGNLTIDFWPQPVEGTCPWHWADECLYNTYVFESTQKIPKDLKAKKLTLYRKNEKVTVDIHDSIRKLKRGLTVCVPPLYWYTDWVKLIAFMEYWKLQGTSKFIIYSHSTNREVKDVLDYYKDQNVVEIVDWPQLPTTREENPNLSLYRLGHSMAHNDCIQRIGTEMGALVDIDEMLLIKGKYLVPTVQELFDEFPSIGALSFPHSVLVLQPPLYSQDHILDFANTDFSGISSAGTANVTGPSKTIFRTEAVRRLATHQVSQFEGNSWFSQKLQDSSALLLHNRYNYADGRVMESTPLSILPPDVNELAFQEKLVHVMRNIFPFGAAFNPETQNVLGKCLGSWRSDGCKTPLTTCREEMEKMEIWVFTEKTDVYKII